MQALRSYLSASVAALALTACASSGGGADNGVPLPELNADGSVAQPKNIALTNLSYLHPSANGAITNGRSAKDEVFDVALTTMTLDVQSNGGLVLNNAANASFGEGGTVSFDYDQATGNTVFNFDISSVREGQTAGTNFQHTFNNIIFAAPTNEYTDVFTLTAAGGTVGQNVARNVITISSLPHAFSDFRFDEVLDFDGSVLYPAFTGFDSSYEGDTARILATLDNFPPAELLRLGGRVDNYLSFDFTTYVGTDGTIYQQGQLDDENPRLYSATGLWFRDTGAQQEFGASVFGVRTPVFDMPTQGKAEYLGSIGGFLFRQNTAAYMTGGANFQVDFATRSADFQLLPAVQETGPDGNVIFQAYENFEGVAVIDNNTITGDFQGTNTPSLTGSMTGAFFGIAAEEISGTFTFGNENVYGIGGFTSPINGNSTNTIDNDG